MVHEHCWTSQQWHPARIVGATDGLPRCHLSPLVNCCWGDNGWRLFGCLSRIRVDALHRSLAPTPDTGEQADSGGTRKRRESRVREHQPQ